MDRDVKWYPNVDLICIFLIVGVIEHIKINLLDIGISIGLYGFPLLICKSSFYRREVYRRAFCLAYEWPIFS